jgi:hypothetical protein
MKAYREMTTAPGRSAGGRDLATPGKHTLTSQLDVNKDPTTTAAPQIASSSAGPAAEQPPADAAASRVPTGDVNSPPVEKYVIPFDRNPKSSPGEQIIFGATYEHPSPASYKLVYTSVGGHFDTQGSGVTTKTFPGLSRRNINWCVDAGWNGTTPVTMKLELQKTDGTVVATTNWTFSKKAQQPTAIAQQETEGERDNPATYTYKLGPARGAGDAYIGYTILEKFAGPYTTNLTLADIKPAYAQSAGLSSNADVARHFFPGTGDNGTFTVSAGDRIADQHGGMSGADQAKAQLVAPKQIEKILTQSYESEPGTVLATYTITRMMKTDDSKKITKKKL